MSGLKSTLLKIVNSGLSSNMLTILEGVSNNNPQILRVLTYHRVDNVDANSNLSPSILSAIPSDFVEQMAFIAKHYHPVSIYDVLEAQRGDKVLPKKAVLVTFDDAYLDFERAWSVMKGFGIPALLFVPTGYPDFPERSLWWDKTYNAIQHTKESAVTIGGQPYPLSTASERKVAYKELREYVKSLPHDEAMKSVDAICDSLNVPPAETNSIMTWAQLEAIAEDGVTLAAHTVTHPLVNRVSLERAVEEAKQSRQDIQKHVGNSPPVFAYPSGGANETVATELAKAGFELAFTTQRGVNLINNWNPLLIRRINIGGNTSLNIMRSQLLGWTVSLNRFFL